MATQIRGKVYLHQSYCAEHADTCWIDQLGQCYGSFRPDMEALGYAYAGHRAGMFIYKWKGIKHEQPIELSA